MRNQVLAFDIYGTLLDTSSVSRSITECLGVDKAKAEEVSKVWRLHQLEYVVWIISTNIY